LDSYYNLPEHRELVSRVQRVSCGAAFVSDPRVSEKIIEGRITPVEGSYSEAAEDPVFLRAQNIAEGHLDFSDAKRLLPEVFSQDKDSILADGDIVLTIDGVRLGKAAVHRAGDEVCCISNHMVRILCGTDLTADYLSWFLNSPAGQQQILRGTTGSAIPGIRTDAIGRICVPLPAPAEQRELVDAMESALDAQRTKLAEADALLAGMDAYLLDVLKLESPTPLRKVYAVKAHQLSDDLSAERYAALQLERTLPWAGSVADAVRLIDTRTIPSQVGPDEEWDWIRIDEIPNRPWQVDAVRTELGSAIEGPMYQVRENDILLARLGPTILNAKFVLAPKPQRQTVASPEFLVLRCKQGWEPEVVLWLLRMKLFRDIMYLRSRGGTPSRYRLDGDDLLSISFPAAADLPQQSIAAEIRRRRERARVLRVEAEAGWFEAKHWFEEQLLGPAN
jgi:restriction endonuclease S subunit